MKRIICCVVFVFLLLVGVAFAENDSLSNATLIATGTTYTSYLKSSSDVDYYQFTLPSDGYVNISFSHGYIDNSYNYWQIYLINGSNEQYLSEVFRGNVESTTNTHYVGLPAGKYYIKIEAINFSNETYSLRVNYTESNVWETEFNNSLTTADPISTDVLYTGSLTNSSDIDYYQFTLPSDGYVNISFSHGYIDYSYNYWDMSLIDGSSEQYLNESFKGNVESTTNTHYVGLPAGKYYIKIEAINFSNETYSLRVNYTESNVWETEFNNSLTTADPISTDVLYTGSLTNSSDIDYYQFTLPSDGYVNISFSHGYIDYSYNYWDISLIDGSSEQYLNESFKGNVESIINTHYVGLPAGKYYIKVGAISFSNETYSLRVNYTESNVWETEFNNSLTTADPISTDVLYTGSLTNSSDIDYYQFTLPSDGYVNISFSHGYIDYSYNYWDISLIDSSSEQYLNESFKGNVESTINTHYVGLPAGKYYIKVRSISYSNETYSLRVNYTESNVWETEFNNSLTTADPISTDVLYTGSLTNSNDTDCYQFTLPSDGYVNISFSHGYIDSSYNYWAVYLMNRDSEQYLSENFEGNVESTVNTHYVGLPAGTYYIKVEDVYFSNETYSLRVNYTETDLWETEFNNTLTTADSIKTSRRYTGSLTNSNDIDWYCFTLSADGNVNISFDHDYLDSSSNYWQLYLIDGDNVQYYQNSYAGQTATAVTSDDIFLTAGKYYIKILDIYYSNLNYIFWVKSDADLILMEGDSGPEVTRLQTALYTLGFYKGTITGNYGSLTALAVRRFQDQYSLTVTGIADDVTQELIYSKVENLEALAYAKVSVSSSILREGPLTSSKAIASLENGTPLTIIGPGNVEETTWYSVRVVLDDESLSGFVRSDLVSIITKDEYENLINQSLGLISLTSSDIALREGPGTSYEVVARAQYGDVFFYTGITNGWYKIKGMDAYINSAYVKTVEPFVLPTALITIESQAFYNVLANVISVPTSVSSIAADAFPSGVTLIVEENSYALQWAKDNNVKYLVE